ncbi:Uncharacterised protein [Salmonella enterica subsp. enterica]|uniref:Uncharacterized protein n=1 Tax=Salmonella enterica I TaxID=59201 RepID=A0A447TXI4_SALET|nr:Uncharacterised protein [Salmonella enterica subsp. enterica]
MKLSRNSRGRKWLKTLGDDALPDLTASTQPSLRGMHKRDKARENTARLCWLLVQLLVEETDGRLWDGRINRLLTRYFES